VDSCIDVRTGNPAPLDYLRLIGIDATAIRLVVATHWHDDHIRGLAEVVRQATKARFVVSMALRSSELATLVSLVEPRMMERSSGVAELADIYRHLGATKTSPTFATADRRLWQPAGKLRRSIWSLSPSDRSIEVALQGISRLFEDSELPNKRIPTLRPNNASVVLWCEFPGVTLLLGADLEETPDDRTGWRAIVASTTRPRGKAALFKVPHHGSATAHNADVWKKMLDASVIAIVTPFSHGGTKLPTAADRSRLVSLSAAAYISSDRSPAVTPWPPAVAATLSETTKAIADSAPPPGHIRLRRDFDGSLWKVELFDGAGQL
jgi:hypothetical protein